VLILEDMEADVRNILKMLSDTHLPPAKHCTQSLARLGCGKNSFRRCGLGNGIATCRGMQHWMPDVVHSAGNRKEFGVGSLKLSTLTAGHLPSAGSIPNLI